ncbi:unnamed protein product [Rangifer tarandus platyrhynchus]|uniref:Uncharacterized protein n=1 Tax=Rangifer tarandus platyrhynchus TaxID=3082113 RepID=A0ACB1KHV5_RANTA
MSQGQVAVLARSHLCLQALEGSLQLIVVVLQVLWAEPDTSTSHCGHQSQEQDMEPAPREQRLCWGSCKISPLLQDLPAIVNAFLGTQGDDLLWEGEPAAIIHTAEEAGPEHLGHKGRCRGLADTVLQDLHAGTSAMKSAASSRTFCDLTTCAQRAQPPPDSCCREQGARRTCGDCRLQGDGPSTGLRAICLRPCGGMHMRGHPRELLSEQAMASRLSSKKVGLGRHMPTEGNPVCAEKLKMGFRRGRAA